MKKIFLTQGKVALVDDADYEWLNGRKWYAAQYRTFNTFYAACAVPVAKRKRRQRTEWMHRLVLGLQPSDKVHTDHRDGNGLNNQRGNLRCCTNRQNHQSSRKRKGCRSRYKGVALRCGGKWQSQIKVNGKLRHIGLFDLETLAAKAYDAAALKHFGDFALTNKTLNLYQERS